MAGTFDFCDTSRVIQELPPEEMSATSFNGWEFTARPAIPYRRTFSCKLFGMYWYLNEQHTALDTTTDPKHNAGRLLGFYQANRTWDVFAINHEYLGNLVVRFKSPITIPPAAGNPGLIEPFEVQFLHYNPGY